MKIGSIQFDTPSRIQIAIICFQATDEQEQREAPTSKITNTAPQQRKRARLSYEKKKESLINTAHALLACKEDKWEVIGKSLGLQLQELTGDQQDIAQKLISDVIFYGKRGRLSDLSCISLNSHPLPSHSSSISNYPYSATPSPSSSIMIPSHGITRPQDLNTTVNDTTLEYYQLN